MEDIICVGAIYFGVFCLAAALMCALAAVLEHFPRVTDKLGAVLFPAAKKSEKARYRVSCSPKCRYYGTLADNDERFDFCYKYHELTDGGCKAYRGKRKP